MANEVAIAFLREIREMIRHTRDVPVLFNDTSLLSRREWRNRAIPVVDGFMFEAAETPEEKLFNMQLGQSTGKVTWTYVGTHTEYNREHMKDDQCAAGSAIRWKARNCCSMAPPPSPPARGWSTGACPRFFYQPEGPLAYESGRYVKEIFDFQQKHDALLRTLRSRSRRRASWSAARPSTGIPASTSSARPTKLLRMAPTSCSRPTATKPSRFSTGTCRRSCSRNTR